MAIQRKDRSFDRIFEQVSLEKVPMDYVLAVKIHLLNGQVIEVDRAELTNFKDESEFSGGIKREDIADIAISLDYEGIKNDVSATVSAILDNLFSEDSDHEAGDSDDSKQ